MAYELRIRLEGLPKTTNTMSGMHWAAKMAHAKRWKRAVWQEVLRQGRPSEPLKHAKLRLVRRSSQAPDFDGLASSFKHLIDGLVESRVLLNDKLENIGMPEYVWEKCPRSDGHVLVEVTEV